MKYPVHIPQRPAIVVKNGRKIQELAQKEVAVRVALLPKTVSAFENGPETTSIENLFKLLAPLDL